MPYLKTSATPAPSLSIGADAVVASVALVTETATATAGATIAWSLQELAPGGTWSDATGMLSGTSGSSVTWTPTGLGYQYQVQAVATYNLVSTTARRAVRCGQGQASQVWTEIGVWDFVAAANVAAPTNDGDPITVAGLTMGTDNAQGGASNGSWSNVNGTGLSGALPASTALGVAASGSSQRTAPILTWTAAQLGLTLDDNTDTLLLFQIAAFNPTNNLTVLQFGVESSTNKMGTGTSGRGEAFGPGRTGGTATAFEHYQDTGGSVGQVSATGSVAYSCATWRVIGVRITGPSTVSFWYSDQTSDFTADDPLSSMVFGDSGPGRFRLSAPSTVSFLAWLGTPSAATPDTAAIQALRVLQRTATLT